MHGVIQELRIKIFLKWKKRGYLKEYCIGVLDVGDEHGLWVSCKGLYMIQDILIHRRSSALSYMRLWRISGRI